MPSLPPGIWDNVSIDSDIIIALTIFSLLINAFYNNIDGPTELIIYLDGIIDSLKDDGSYKSGTITSKIKILRINKKDFFYYNINGYLKNQEKNLIQYVNNKT